SIDAASATVGTPNPCPGPLFGYPRGPGDILTEGTALGAPGAACVLVPATTMNLWSGTAFGCPVNPFGAVDDDIDGLAIAVALGPPVTVTPTPTVTATPTETPT